MSHAEPSHSKYSLLPRLGALAVVAGACALAFLALVSAFPGGKSQPSPPSVVTSPESPAPETSPLAEEWKRREVKKIAAEHRRDNVSSQIAAVALIGLVLFLIYTACSR